jgi:hypothetical protein
MDVGARLQSLGLADRNRVIRLDEPRVSFIAAAPLTYTNVRSGDDPTLRRRGREGPQWVGCGPSDLAA